MAAKYLDKFAAKFKSINDIDEALEKLGLKQYSHLWATLVEDEIEIAASGVWYDDEIVRTVFTDNSMLELRDNQWKVFV